MDEYGVTFNVTMHKKWTRKRWTLKVKATTSPNAIEEAFQLMMKTGFNREELYWDKVEMV